MVSIVAKRQKISASRKLWVLKRDNNACKVCGFTPASEREMYLLEIDHIVPVIHGGTSAADNLQVLCNRCNNRKGSKSMEDFEADYWGRLGEVHWFEMRQFGEIITRGSDLGWL